MKLSENRDEFRAPALMRLFDREVGYDPDGNRTSDSFRGPAQFIDDQIVRYGNSEYQSDSQGFGRLAKKIQTSGLAQIYDYRADGEMTFFARTELSNRHGDPEEEQNSLFVQYYFDPLGRRVAKRIQARHDSFTQTYGYLGEQNKILLAKAGNGKKTLYMDGPGMDEHIGEISVDHALGYARDHLGSVLNSAPAGVLHASMPPSFWVGASPKSTSWGALLQCGPRFR